MEKRSLGQTDLRVAPLAFGGNVFGWTVDEAESFKLLDAFVSGGANLVDTANVYSRWKPGNKGGESETIIGNWLHKTGNRDKIVLVTKVGSDMGDGKNVRKDTILKDAEASLKRLQTDHIDLYFTHFDDGVTPVAETLEAYDNLIKAGKVRWIGASNMSAERLQESLDVSAKNGLPRYQVLQPEYNLYDREPFESTYQPIAEKENLGVMCYYGLASGFLTGKYRSVDDLNKSQRGQGAKKYLNEKGFKLLKVLDGLAEEYGTMQATVAIAWLMAQPTITAPIASATSEKQLQSLLAALELKLSDEDLNLLTDVGK